MKFGNEFWLILFREYISPKLFAVCIREGKDVERGMEVTVIAEGRGKGGEKKERKKVYLSSSRQTMNYCYYSKHI